MEGLRPRTDQCAETVFPNSILVNAILRNSPRGCIAANRNRKNCAVESEHIASECMHDFVGRDVERIGHHEKPEWDGRRRPKCRTREELGVERSYWRLQIMQRDSAIISAERLETNSMQSRLLIIGQPNVNPNSAVLGTRLRVSNR
jgi:hypothetical protein